MWNPQDTLQILTQSFGSSFSNYMNAPFEHTYKPSARRIANLPLVKVIVKKLFLSLNTCTAKYKMVVRRKLFWELCIEQYILDLSIQHSIRTSFSFVSQKLQKMLRADMKTTKASFRKYEGKIFVNVTLLNPCYALVHVCIRGYKMLILRRTFSTYEMDDPRRVLYSLWV